MCVYIYIYIYICVYIYIYIYICIYIYIYISSMKTASGKRQHEYLSIYVCTSIVLFVYKSLWMPVCMSICWIYGQTLINSIQFNSFNSISIQFNSFLFGQLKDKDSNIKHLNVPNTR